MDNGSAALAVIDSPSSIEHSSSEHHRRATDAAGLVRAIVLGKAIQVSGRKYVPVDAYQAIANAMGCVASARDVRRVEGGYTAIGEVKRLSDGAVVAEGEGFVGDDEPKWAKGPEYARRAMVQTRAIGRACRAAFAFVVPMIDLGLSSTPAEEMDGVAQGSIEPPSPLGTQALKAKLKGHASTPPRASPPKTAPATKTTHDRGISFRFGRDSGVPLSDLSESSLAWYRDCLQNDIASTEPKKQQYAAANRMALNALDAELAYRDAQ